MRIPKAIQSTIESFEKLPGVGPKTAQRLTFYLLHVPQQQLDGFAEAVKNLKLNTVLCSVCFSVGEEDPCNICSSNSRDQGMICVVEQALDVLALEKSGRYNGVYHVLHGKIDPLNSIGPDEIYIRQLFDRIRNSQNGHSVTELILATNPTMEGEATAMYIAKEMRDKFPSVSVTRIGRGLPIGADLEYADSVTLQRAMEGRSQY
ncbi:recombination protein RecR [soil metagenome]